MPINLGPSFPPVFPRYVFVIIAVNRQPWRRINGTYGVGRIVTKGERPQAVRPGIVETLIQSCDGRGALVFKPDDLAIGNRMRLLAGPFAGALGVLQRLDGSERAQLLLDLLDSQVKLSVSRDMVAPAP